MNTQDNYIREAMKNLSSVNLDFLEFTARTPESMKRSSFSLMELNDDLFKLQPWPTFINRSVKQRFEEASVSIFKLIRRLPPRLFQNDSSRMSEYFNIPAEEIQHQLKGVTEDHLDNLLGRGDFILSQTGFKCLEFNVTPSLGGWQVPIWESLALNTPVIRQFFKEKNCVSKNENLLGIFMEHLVDCCIAMRSQGENQLNAVFLSDTLELEHSKTTEMYLGKLFREKLKLRDNSLSGNLYFCGNEPLSLEDNKLFCHGHRLHAAVELCFDMLSGDVIEALRHGNLRLMNGPVYNLLSNKLTLAALYENRDNPCFTPAEQQVIHRYIPQTRRVVPEIRDELFAGREQFVLKPGSGHGGDGVCVGPKVTGQQWRETVERALEKKGWLAQEYIEGSPGYYQAGDYGFAPHDIAWGLFVFGSRYAGAWARVMPQQGSKGVINCHQGATVSVIFEV